MARSTRRFGMGDLMLLIVALAVGMWGARSLVRELTAGQLRSSHNLHRPG